MELAGLLALAQIIISALGFVRAKSLLERVVNFDLIFVGFVILVVLSGAAEKHLYWFDLALLGLLFSFLGSVLVANQYLEEVKLKGDIDDFRNN